MTDRRVQSEGAVGGHYISCLKIDGVPLLPPVFSGNYKAEMQYYRALAVEVERRISSIKSICSRSPERSTVQQEPSSDNAEHEERTDMEDFDATINDQAYDSFHSHVTVVDNSENAAAALSSPQLVHSVDYNLNETAINNAKHVTTSDDDSIPEKDTNCNQSANQTIHKTKSDLINALSLSFRSGEMNQEGDNGEQPDQQIKKSFTGSLQNVNQMQSDQQNILHRQNSYTLDNPSPLLLNYLEEQSLCAGVDVACISMSELSIKSKRRKSWDIDAKKEPWTSKSNGKTFEKERKHETSPFRKNGEKRQSGQAMQKKFNVKVNQQKNLPKQLVNSKKEEYQTKSKQRRTTKLVFRAPNLDAVQSLSETESWPFVSDATTNLEKFDKTTIEDLFEKMKIQQNLQMNSLMDRQKREQSMLQKLFEEQNQMFYQKMKSLSRHIMTDYKPEAQCVSPPCTPQEMVNVSMCHMDLNMNNTVSRTLENSRKCFNSTETVLKKSRQVLPATTRSPTRIPKSKSRNQPPLASPVKTPASPNKRRGSPRRYSLDEPIISGRTNDTLADANYSSLSPDENGISEDYEPVGSASYTRVTPNGKISRPVKERIPTQRELLASSKITAACRGYLVRRLMRTERVKTTVATLRDALCCALELHRDKDRIRGADIDLHRRLIQQITAACYDLHDTFIASTSRQRCEVISQDRERLKAKMSKYVETKTLHRPKRMGYKQTDL